jgi:UDP-N-acetylglucosamine 2-epimerase
MRETTERPEALQSGAVELVGTDVRKIVTQVSLLLTDTAEYASRQIDVNPYGDGHSAERIVDLILRRAWQRKNSISQWTDSTPQEPVLPCKITRGAV